jgi:hypothetical protein
LLGSKRATLEVKFQRVFGLSSPTMEGWPGFAELLRIAERQPEWRVSASSLDLYKWAGGWELMLRLELDSSHDILWARIARDGVLLNDSIAVADRHTWERRSPRAWLRLLEIAALDSDGPYRGDWQAILRELAVYSGLETEVDAPVALGGMRFEFLHAYLAAHMRSTLNDKDEDRDMPTLLEKIEDAWNRLPLPGLGNLHHPRELREGPINELLAPTWDVFLNAVPHREIERDALVSPIAGVRVIAGARRAGVGRA